MKYLSTYILAALLLLVGVFGLKSGVEAAQSYFNASQLSTTTTPGYVFQSNGPNAPGSFVATSTLGFASGGVTSFNSRTGAVTPQSGDYTTSIVAEGTNLYFTTARATANFISNLAATTSIASITTLPNLSLPYTQLTGVPSFLTNITGLITPGTNVTITGSGTSGSPYVINSTVTGGAAYPFPLTGNATSTLTQFNGGLTAYASSTIGNGTFGLTVNGNATTTGIGYFAGNVGIGSTSPSSLLTVNSAASTPALAINDTGTGNAISVYNGSTPLMTLNNQGAFTTYNQFVSYVNGAGNQYFFAQNDGAGGVNFGAYNNSFVPFKIDGSPLALNSRSTGNSVDIGTSTGSAMLNIAANGFGNIVTAESTSGASLFGITSAGNVGIGTSTPGSLLSIQGIANLGTATSTFEGTGGINLTSGCYAINGICLSAGGSNYWTSSGGNIYNNTGTNVGINNSSPAYTLDVGGFINIGSNYGYKIGGTTAFAASSTNQITFGGLYAGQHILSIATSSANTSGYQDTGFGYNSLAGSSLSGYGNAAFGWNTLLSDTSGFDNTALGASALGQNTTGNYNVSVGGALFLNTSGSQNLAIGQSALGSNVSGSTNIGIGSNAGTSNTSASGGTMIGAEADFGNTSVTNDVAIGFQAGAGAYSSYANQGSTYVGANAGYNVQTGSDYNTLIGFNQGYNITSGAGNVLIGTASSSANSNLTSGYGNILLGNNISFPSATASNQIDIGNLIYGTGVNGVGSTLSTGNIGIGTTSPYGLLSIGNTNGIGFTTATSTFNSTGGINLTSGCYAISGTCIGGSAGYSPVGTTGQFPIFTSTNTLTATSGISINTTSGAITIPNLATGILHSVGGLISSSLVSLTSDITGILGFTHGGTATSTAPTANTLYYADANGNLEYAATSSLGIYSNYQTFTSSGTFTVPSGVKAVFVTIVGGGGGGGGTSSSGSTVSAGGGGGGCEEGWINTSATTSIGVTIGAAGSGGSTGNTGGTGGTTYVSSYMSATGGSGGTYISTNIGTYGGAGGSGSGGQTSIPGGYGPPAFLSSASNFNTGLAGLGGSSCFGGIGSAPAYGVGGNGRTVGGANTNPVGAGYAVFQW